MIALSFLSSGVFFLMIRRPPRSTRTDTLFPYTTLFLSNVGIAPQIEVPMNISADSRMPARRPNTSASRPHTIEPTVVPISATSASPLAVGVLIEYSRLMTGITKPSVAGFITSTTTAPPRPTTTLPGSLLSATPPPPHDRADRGADQRHQRQHTGRRRADRIFQAHARHHEAQRCRFHHVHRQRDHQHDHQLPVFAVECHAVGDVEVPVTAGKTPAAMQRLAHRRQTRHQPE